MVTLTRPVKAIQNAMDPSCASANAVSQGIGLLGMVLLGVALVTTIVMLPDMVRYIRIKTM